MPGEKSINDDEPDLDHPVIDYFGFLGTGNPLLIINPCDLRPQGDQENPYTAD